jgi:hypothetical protein
MGLDFDSLCFLNSARQAGHDFGVTMTIGRQQLVDQRRIARLLAIRVPSTTDSRFAEWALRGLGAREVESMDASRYEGASLAHDLNHPVPSEWHARYDAVIDGGSLEHVFDVRQALANVMNLVRVGGSVFLITPASNAMGHGFYQFSPELFYRVFAAENGFQMKRMLIQPLVAFRRTYEVADPASVGERVALVHRAPIRLLVHAVRTAQLPVLENAPQQSDYSAAWVNKADGPSSLLQKMQRWGFRSVIVRLPPSVRDAFHQWYFRTWRHSLHNRRFFRPTRP